MSLKKIELFVRSNTKYSNSRKTKFYSMVRALKKAEITNIQGVKKFILEVKSKEKKEAISNLINMKLDSNFAERTAKDYLSNLTNIINDLEKKKSKIILISNHL